MFVYLTNTQNLESLVQKKFKNKDRELVDLILTFPKISSSTNFKIGGLYNRPYE
jgi:hypothetical protein